MLADFFIRSAKKNPSNISLEVGERSYTYAELSDLSQKIAASIGISPASKERVGDKHFICILSNRSITSYAGVLGTLISGNGYVPLNPKFPVERTLTMFNISQAHCIIIGDECHDHLQELLPFITKPLLLLFPDTNELNDIADKYPQHIFITRSAIAEQKIQELTKGNSDPIAYLLFTSGSTGIPKGVPVSNSNAVAYISYILNNYKIISSDRCSQAFDLTFDPSVHDMFVCWGAGACLCVVPQEDVMAPAKFIRDKNLTVWYSVPSIGKMLAQMRMLKPTSFPLLKYSFFSAEALTQKMTEEWQEAAPNSTIVNFYGPTEVTVNVTHYAWNPKTSPQKCINGNVPLGKIFETQQYFILDENKNKVISGEPGELYLSGSQLTKGYLNDPEKTAYHYVTISNEKGICYRTGDLVKEDIDGDIHFLGRIDDQIKIRGFRVELQEIDFVLQSASGTDLAIAIPIRNSDNSVKKIAAFICDVNGNLNTEIIMAECRKKLPDYMIPSEIYFVKQMPLNANGKIDRKQLLKNIV